MAQEGHQNELFRHASKPRIQAFGVGMFDYMVSGGSMLGQFARGRRDTLNNIR